MILKKSILSVILSSVLLIVCDKPTDANEKNFRQSIQKAIDEKVQKVIKTEFCIPLNGLVDYATIEKVISGLSDIDQDKNKVISNIVEKLGDKADKLVNNFDTYYHNLMSKMKSENKNKYMLTFNANKMSDENKTNLARSNFMSEFNSEFFELIAPDMKFYVTNSLSTNIKKRKNGTESYSCSEGEFIVDKIIEFSEPTELLGKIITEVKYTVKANFPDSWANDLTLQRNYQYDTSSQFYNQLRDFRLLSFPKKQYNGKPFTATLYKTNNGWTVSSISL